MLVFDDAGIGNLAGREVHAGHALIVFLFEAFGFEAQAAVFEISQPVAEVGVDLACVEHCGSGVAESIAVRVIVHAELHFHAFEQAIDDLVVAAHGNALPAIFEIVVVVGKAHGQTPDDEGRQFRAASAPLLFRVALDELFVDITAHQADGLLLEVAGLVIDDAALLVDFR